MKNKKGFTLIEVLSIIVVLGIIAVLVLPKISNNMSDKKQKQYEKIVEIIENAGKVYFSSHRENTCVSIDILLQEKYLSSDLTNPITNENITGYVNKIVEDGFNKYTFSNACF